MNKAYRFRIYPNSTQKTMFGKTFGCVRFISKIQVRRDRGKISEG